MKKKNTLKVKPLRRYNTPVYPSYLDKNPIEHPDTLPYPFTYKALQVLAGAGILVGASCAPTKQVADNAPVIQPELAVQDSLVNPFTFENLRVPYRPASFGTGMASRLKGDEARAVINKVFQEEGIDLEKNYFYKKDSISVVLNGFNADLNIGYVWIDRDKMGDGMVISSRPIYYEAILKNCFLNYDVDKLRSLERNIERTIKRKEGDYADRFGERFEIAKNIETDEQKLLAFKEIYLDCLIYNHNKHTPQISEFKNIADNSFQEKEKAYLESLLKSKIKNSLNQHPQKTILTKIFNSIIDIEDEKIRKEQYDNFTTFMRESFQEKYRTITSKILSMKNKRRMAEKIQVFGFKHLDKKLTLEEAKYLGNIHKEEKDFIASIGTRDGRFFYGRGIPKFTPEEEEKLEKIKESGNKEEYKQAYFETIEVAEKRDPKDEALKALETQVRQYIQWAKQQGKN